MEYGKYGMCSVECTVWSVNCGFLRVEFKGWSVVCIVQSVECGVSRVEFEVWSLECGVQSVKHTSACGVVWCGVVCWCVGVVCVCDGCHSKSV